ncbi:uncharacterized protein LOC136076944 [Hydra vulgaris]|uniref:Uncharacterized protein LOC136076944 n=1 Tax=Hydra vulgaris TaxID=6087 RepID=A0ABM4BDJ7_HYDVU
MVLQLEAALKHEWFKQHTDMITVASCLNATFIQRRGWINKGPVNRVDRIVSISEKHLCFSDVEIKNSYLYIIDDRDEAIVMCGKKIVERSSFFNVAIGLVGIHYIIDMENDDHSLTVLTILHYILFKDLTSTESCLSQMSSLWEDYCSYKHNQQEEEDITNSIRSESDANSVHELEDLTLNYDVGNWPTPMPDYLRADVIRQGSDIYQNLEGPFDPVHKPGEMSKGQTRQLTKSWFYKKLPSGEQILRKWMVYSHEKKSLFCFCCKLFDKNDNPTTKSSFITGFNSWWKLNPKVSDHKNTQLHINNLDKWKTLEARLLQNKTIDAAHQDVMEEEMERHFASSLRYKTFLAKQNLPFRGHREDFASENRGNFLEIVSLLSNYDPVLKEHSIRLQQSSESGLIPVSYLSPAVQNEFVSLLGDAVKQELICEIKKAKFYTILFDSTPNIYHTEQMSQVIRYVKIDNRNVGVKESFLCFISLSGKKADSITQKIIQSLEKDGLDLKLCRSQEYENATTMSYRSTNQN